MSNSFKPVPLFALRAAVAVVGFDPAASSLDKTIGDNVTHHRNSSPDTKLNMSSAVVDRVIELTNSIDEAGRVSAETDAQTKGATKQTKGATEQTKGATEQTTGPTEQTTGPAEQTTGPTEQTTGPAEQTTGPTEPTTGPTAAITEPGDLVAPSPESEADPAA